MTLPNEITLPAFMDMHVHLREGPQLVHTTYYSWLWCDTVVAMPNLVDPLVNPSKIKKYREEILTRSCITPPNIIIPLYLTPETTPQDIFRAWGEGVICAKAYPKGRTSHSQHGITNFFAMDSTFRAMAEVGMKLLIHPEHPSYKSWEAEDEFFKQIWPFFRKMVESDTGIKISLEHISTQRGVREIQELGSNQVVGTITPHHLLSYIGDLVDELDSAYHCKPVLKQGEDRQTLRCAAMSGLPFFLLGSDSAPWLEKDKIKRHPCAGCWTAPWLPQFLATVFHEEDSLDKLQTFTHDNAVRWWGLKPATRQIRIFSGDNQIPEENAGCFPFWGGKTLFWGAEQAHS